MHGINCLSPFWNNIYYVSIKVLQPMASHDIYHLFIPKRPQLMKHIIIKKTNTCDSYIYGSFYLEIHEIK